LPPLLIPQLFFLLFLLILDGEPFRFFLLRRLKLFSDLDLMQIIILDTYLGGFFLYALAILPLQLFSWPILFGFTMLCLFLSITLHFKALSRLSRFSKIRTFLAQNRKASLEHAAVFAMFIFFFVFNLVVVSGFVFGSVRDESLHSLSVEVILENKQIPVTLQPYLAEGIIYPQASHVIFGFASYMLGMEVPEAVFYVSILFKSLAVFGAYFLGKKLSSRRAYYLGLTFVFAFISSWPLFVAWGGNPFLIGFPLFLVSLGLLFPIARNGEDCSLAELAAIGLLFGYCATIIISYLETIFAAGFLIVLYWLVTRHKNLRRNLFTIVAVLLISLVPLSPFLYRFFDFYRYPGHNIGIPSDFSQWPRQQYFVTQAIQWIFENLSPYLWLSIFTMLLLAGFAVLMWKTREFKDIKGQTGFALTLFAAAGLLSFVAFFLPPDFNVVSWGHQGAILIVPINMIIIAFYIKINDICRGHKIKTLEKVFSKDTYSGVLLAFMILLLINAPFIYHRLVMDPQTLTGAYGLYAVTTEGDHDLMLWMKANLTSAVVLVNPNDPGLFIPAVSHQRIIFPYSGSSYALSYQTLVNLTSDHALNDTTYDLMQKYNITHVFVGAAATGWWVEDFRWDPLLFLGNPNFKLVESFGSAYLFGFTYTDPRVAFNDNFDNANWSVTGWQAKSEGKGQGNVTTTSAFRLNITAQAAYTVSNWQYATYISRKIFVLNDSDVGLSFSLNATEGFSVRDTFAAIVSNVYGNQSYVIATPDGVYENYRHSRSLPASAGFFEFTGKDSISSLWRQAYNSTLPNPFVLEFVNWDFDGVQNVAYLGNVTVTTSPVH
jgi:hypothetical protein